MFYILVRILIVVYTDVMNYIQFAIAPFHDRIIIFHSF